MKILMITAVVFVYSLTAEVLNAQVQTGPNATFGNQTESTFENDNFAGVSSSDVQGFRGGGNGGNSAMNAMGMMGMGGMGRGMMGGMMGGGFGGMGRGMGGFGMQNQNDPRMSLRIPFRIGFTVNRAAPELVQSRAQNRLQRIPALAKYVGVTVQMDGRTAVLNGTVGTERDKRLVELVLRLEPGIREIENELTVDAGNAE